MKQSLILLFFLLEASSMLFAQKIICDHNNYTLSNGLVDGQWKETFEFYDHPPYIAARSEQRWVKTFINKNDCDNRPYQTILFDDFLDTLNTERWLTYYPYPEPFKRTHIPESTSINLDKNLSIDNGILTIEMHKEKIDYEFYYENDTEPTTTTMDWSNGMIHSNNKTNASSSDSGCFRYGKFSSRLKIPGKGANCALWFFGWAGEIDVMEFFRGPDGPFQTTLHSWSVPRSNGESHVFYDLKYYRGNLSKDFHVFALEWTPYKLVWYLDDEPIRTFYRFYELEKQGDQYCMNGLDCENIPLGENQLWEHVGWDRLSLFYLDLILTIAPFTRHEEADSAELLIDWVKVEQKTGKLVMGPDFICDQDVYEYQCNDDNVLEWNYSANLEVVETAGNTIKVRKKEQATDNLAWVEAQIPNEFSCHNNPVRKEFWLGAPAQRPLSYVHIPCDDQITINTSINPLSVTSIDWEITNTSNTINNDGSSITAIFDNSNEPININLTIENSCGTNTQQENYDIPFCTNNDLQLYVFPNPTRDVLNVRFLNFPDFIENQTLLLLNEQGKLVQKFQVSSKYPILDLSNVANGVYFLSTTLPNSKKQVAAKIIVRSFRGFE